MKNKHDVYLISVEENSMTQLVMQHTQFVSLVTAQGVVKTQ